MLDPLSTHVFESVSLCRNKLRHLIDPAPVTMTDRASLKYFLSIEVPTDYNAPSFSLLHESQSREKPVQFIGALQIWTGAEFEYNRKNGKIDGLMRLEKPRWQQAIPMVSITQTQRFRLRERITGGVPAQNTNVLIPEKWGIKAGLSEPDAQLYSDVFFGSFQQAERRFLTHRPNGSQVGLAQEEYLSFLLNMSPLPTEVRLRVQFDVDSFHAGTQTVSTLTDLQRMAVVVFPCGTNVIDLPRNCTRYAVWLSDQNNARLSEVRYYYPDRMGVAQERSLLFSNSLGGWDTLRLTGDATENVKVQQSFARREKSASDTYIYQPELFVTNTEGDREISVSTGYYPRDAQAMRQYSEELLLSEDIYLITNKGHRQLRRQTSQIVVAADNSNLIAQTWVFTFVDSSQNYSNLAGVDVAPARPTAWKGAGVLTYELDANGFRTGRTRPRYLQLYYTDTNTPVRPNILKMNTQGTEGYLGFQFDGSVTVGFTPHPSAGISGISTFLSGVCVAPLVAQPVPLNVPAGSFGGENPGDADALSVAYYNNVLNTQAWADANGACVIQVIEVEAEILMTNPPLAPAASGGRVAFPSGNPLETCSVPVTLPVGRIWTLDISYYANGTPRVDVLLDDVVMVNNLTISAVWPYNTGAVLPGVFTVSFPITAGSHVIKLRISASNIGGINFDKIKFS